MMHVGDYASLHTLYNPPQQTHATVQWMHTLNMAEQMGVDPISKLAGAINNLADALRARDASES